MPGYPRHDDPRHDLDRAGFGVVAVGEHDQASWTPKEAFHAVARRYAGLG